MVSSSRTVSLPESNLWKSQLNDDIRRHSFVWIVFPAVHPTWRCGKPTTCRCSHGNCDFPQKLSSRVEPFRDINPVLYPFHLLVYHVLSSFPLSKKQNGLNSHHFPIFVPYSKIFRGPFFIFGFALPTFRSIPLDVG